MPFVDTWAVYTIERVGFLALLFAVANLFLSSSFLVSNGRTRLGAWG